MVDEVIAGLLVRKPGGKMPEYVRQGSCRSFAPPNGISGFKTYVPE
jgi:hypothetical protein